MTQTLPTRTSTPIKTGTTSQTGTPVYLDPARRHDVTFLIDVRQSNPNGDPDLDGQPRVNPHNNHGFITGVSVKRKIRDHVLALHPEMSAEQAARCEMQIAAGTVLARTTAAAYTALKLNVSEGVDFSENEIRALVDGPVSLPDAFEIDSESVTYDGSLKNAALVKLWAELKAGGMDADLIEKLKASTAQRKVTPAERLENEEKVKPYLQARYYDSRIFGFTSPGKDVSAGKMRGPVQIGDPVSLEEVNLISYAVTRSARAKDDDKEGSQFGRRSVIDHATYQGQLFYSPHHARGVDQEDLRLLFDGLMRGYETTRSSARPFVSVVRAYVFSHDSRLGNAPAHTLFDLLNIRGDGSGGYTATEEDLDLPKGVTLTVLK